MSVKGKIKSIDEVDKTDIFGETALWVWGKSIPLEIFEFQRFLRKSPIGKYVRKLEKENKELSKYY
jgi:hypothetical protein